MSIMLPLELIEYLTVERCNDGEVDVHYYCKGQKFERIRRITGYITGDVKTWNNAKQAEESERVKHGVGITNFKELQK